MPAFPAMNAGYVSVCVYWNREVCDCFPASQLLLSRSVFFGGCLESYYSPIAGCHGILYDLLQSPKVASPRIPI